MKTRIRLFTILMVAVFIMAAAVPAFAADGSITVQNAVNGEKYNIYKVFDVASYTTGANQKVAYTYNGATNATFLANLQASTSPFTLTQIGSTGVYNVVKKDTATDAQVLDFIKANAANLGSVAKPEVTAASNTAAFTGLDYGYYYVTSSLGSLVIIDSTLPNVTIADKNTPPTVTKEVQEGSSWGDTADASIGDEVSYRITVNTGTGLDQDITLTDVMTNLTYKADSVSITGWTAGTDYTVTWNDGTKTLTVVLKAAKVAATAANTDVVVSYVATLDSSAVTTSEGNPNTVTMTYSEQSDSDSAKVKTYQFDVVKTDGSNNLLIGAKFKLYDAASGGNEIGLVYDNARSAYRPATASETAVEIDMTSNAQVKILGLDAGTYYLEETAAPAGYNPLTARQAVVLTANNDATVDGSVYQEGGVQVINNTGSELPATGSTGTRIFVTVGLILCLGTGIFLVTNRKMRNEEI